VILIGVFIYSTDAVHQQAVNCTYFLAAEFEDALVFNTTNTLVSVTIYSGLAAATRNIGNTLTSRSRYYHADNKTTWSEGQIIQQPSYVHDANVQQFVVNSMYNGYNAVTGNNTVDIYKYNSTSQAWALSFVIHDTDPFVIGKIFGFYLSLWDKTLVVYSADANQTNQILFFYKRQTNDSWLLDTTYDLSSENSVNWLIIFNDTVVLDVTDKIILQNVGGNWTETQRLIVSNGYSVQVGLDFNHLLVSEPNNLIVYEKTYNDTTQLNEWNILQNITELGAVTFPNSYAVNGDFIIASDASADSDRGLLYSYIYNVTSGLFEFSESFNLAPYTSNGAGSSIAYAYGDCFISSQAQVFGDMYCHLPQDFCGVCGGTGSSCILTTAAASTAAASTAAASTAAATTAAASTAAATGATATLTSATAAAATATAAAATATAAAATATAAAATATAAAAAATTLAPSPSTLSNGQVAALVTAPVVVFVVIVIAIGIAIGVSGAGGAAGSAAAASASEEGETELANARMRGKRKGK